MKYLNLKYLFLLIILNYISIFAELKVTSYRLKVDDYPYITGTLSATDNGAPASGLNAIFIEGLVPVVPDKFTENSPGSYEFGYYTSTNSWDPDDKYVFSNSITVYNDKETAYSSDTELMQQAPIIRIVKYFSKGEEQADVRFGNIVAGDTVGYQVQFQAHINDIYFAQFPTLCDTVTVESDNFYVKWLGPEGNPTQFNGFPTALNPNVTYWFNIYYTPKETNAFLEDMITIHFNGGNKYQIPISVGSKAVTSDPVMEILSPNAGDIFTPCETVEIKWKGHNKDTDVKIYFDAGNGTWQQVASVRGDSYLWTVPSQVSQNARIRLMQDAYQSPVVNMVDSELPVYSVDFNDAGTELVSFSAFGGITEWDLFSNPDPVVINRYNVDESPDKYTNARAFYSNGSDKIAAAYYWQETAKSYVYFFEKGNNAPFNIYESPNNYIIFELENDAKKNYLALIPENNAKMILLDPETGNYKNEINFDYPILRAKFNNKLEKLVVVLMNGDFIIMNSSNFAIEKKFQIFDFKLITAIDYSDNGKLITVSFRGIDSDGKRRTNCVIDTETDFISRRYSHSAANTAQLRFSPSSGSLIVGAENGSPQIKLYDMVTYTEDDIGWHSGRLTDLAISSDGHALVSSSVSNDNLFLKKFAFPEDVISDAFIIQEARLSTDPITLNEAYIGTETTINIKSVCNVGDALIDITDVLFVHGRNFRLAEPSRRDTLMPGECTDLDIIYMPLDTGMISDSIAFRVCGVDIMVPIFGKGLPRNITFSNPNLYFGEVCVGDTAIFNNFAITNEDPVELILNRINITTPEFSFTPITENIRIPAGGSHEISIIFIPTDIGEFRAELEIYHSNQDKLIEKTELSATGIGADISVSHEKLLFIPERLERELTITNNTNIDVNISALVTIPEGYFQNITNLPITLRAKESQTFTIVWNGEEPTEKVVMKIEADPCVIQKYLEIGLYSGNSSITVIDTVAGPLDEAAIRIKYKNTENGEYNGIRDFEGVITLNPRLFLPFEVISDFGAGEITRNEVIDGLRHIGFKVSGNFVTEGNLAIIKGIPGLAETNTTVVQFSPNATYWGSAVNTSFGYGNFTVDDKCTDRRIIRETGSLKIISISPTPAIEFVSLDFDSEISGKGYLTIYDNLGLIALNSGPYQIAIGRNKIELNISGLSPGTYRIHLQADAEMLQESLIIMR